MAYQTPLTAFSQAMHSITNIKLAELHKKRESYRSKRQKLDDNNHSSKHSSANLLEKTQAVTNLKLPFADSKELANIARFLRQAKYDSSVSGQHLSKYHSTLHSLLEQQAHRLDYAKLYSAILKEHLQTRADTPESDVTLDNSSLDGSYDMLEIDRLDQLRQKFENVVFTSAEIDESEFSDYLHSLFSTDDLKKTLRGMQKRFRRDTTIIFENPSPFNSENLYWIMQALLKNSLLKDEKKDLLKSFQRDSMLMEEICDVLNMRYTELNTWSWTHDGQGLHVEPRRQLNGKYRVVMDEDILDAMLLHYIGVTLCANAKEELTYWLSSLLIPDSKLKKYVIDRRSFYQQEPVYLHKSLQHTRNSVFSNDFFVSHLPRSIEDDGGYDDDEEGNKDKKSWVDVKQQLLRHIASEVTMRRHTTGNVAVVQTDLQWFATSIPHSTIFTILRFIGLSDEWLHFFKSYLETPLNMGKADGDDRMRMRCRGIPMGQSLEKYLGELVLVFLDVAVKCEADVLLYRMHDDIFFYGTIEECERAWAALQKFVNLTGLEVNQKKTGSACVSKNPVRTNLPKGDVVFDFLKLGSDGSWKVDHSSVSAHTKQLRKQLDECKDILSFVRTYNSCIGRFFGHTFGTPARCFGPKHVDDVLQTHQRMQQELFGSDGISVVLRKKLKQLAQDEGLDIEPSDCFIFAPVAFGGLGVANPFIPLLLKYQDLTETPDRHVEQYLEKEKETYESLRKRFDNEHNSDRKKRFTQTFKDYDESDQNLVSRDEFLTFEEYTEHREWLSPTYRDLYLRLVSQPEIQNIDLSGDVKASLEMMPHGMKAGDVTSAEKYTLQLFSDELLNQFGTLQILDRGTVPIGIVKAILGEKVTWQMVL